MGQYYRGTILKKNWKNLKGIVEFACSSWAFGTGAKLMEHSYIGVAYVLMYEQLLATKYFGFPFVWCGDYADHKRTKGHPGIELCNRGLELPENEATRKFLKEHLTGEQYSGLFNKDKYNTIVIPDNKEIREFCEEASGIVIDDELDVYSEACEWTSKHEETTSALAENDWTNATYYKYAVNLTKKEYVVIKKFKKNEWRVHPLPLLCADGNGRGGGDYREDFDAETGDKKDNGYEYVGRWAYDCIGITNDKKKLEGFTEIKPNFYEKW